MLCQECSKWKRCKRLCKKAERYVNQDYVSQRERPIPPLREKDEARFNSNLDNINYHSSVEHLVAEYPLCDFPFLTDLQNKCLQMFYAGELTYWEIARNLKINKYKVDNCIRSAKRDISRFFSKQKEVI